MSYNDAALWGCGYPQWLLNDATPKKVKKGGHAIILNDNARDEFIGKLRTMAKGRSFAGKCPYTIPVARVKANQRKATVDSEILDYLENNDEMDDALLNATTWKEHVARARKALKKKSAYIKQIDNFADFLSRGQKRKKSKKTKKTRRATSRSAMKNLPSLEF